MAPAFTRIGVNAAELTTVNVTALLVPFAVDTVTLYPPGVAFVAMVNVAVIWVPLTTLTLLAVTPAGVLTVAPEAKFDPVNVTAIDVPAVPLFGDIDESDGTGGVTEKLTELLVPPDVVTLMLYVAGVVLEAMAKVAVI